MPGHHDHEHGGGGDRTGRTASTTDQLNAAARSIATLSAQIDAILATWIDPPEPDKPAAISATSTILTQAAHITDTANTIMAKLRGTA